MGLITKIVRKKQNSDSLQTAIPAGMMRQMGLKEGDKLEWRFMKKGKKAILSVLKHKRKKKKNLPI